MQTYYDGIQERVLTDDVRNAQQQLIDKPLLDMGTLISSFSQSFLTASFHPTTAYRENRLIFDDLPDVHESLYQAMVKLTDLQSSELVMPSIELPVLLYDIGGELDPEKMFSSDEDINLHVYYTHREEYRKRILGNTKELYIEPGRYSIIAYFNEKYNAGVESLYNFFDSFDVELEKFANISSSKREILTYQTGSEMIQDLYESNYYGIQLAKHIRRVQEIMRLSMVTGRNNFQSNEYLLDTLNTPHIKQATLKQDIERLELIKNCTLQPSGDSCYLNFFHSLTSEGICSTFNGISFREMFIHDTSYVKVHLQLIFT